MKKITFRVNEDRLKGTLFYPSAAKDNYPGILFIHGWTSTEKGYAEYSETLNKLGFACMTFDLRGHGNSDGDIKIQTRQEFLEDTIAAYDYLAQSERIDKDDITVVGSSFGSYLAALLTQHRPIKRLILRVPANYPNGNTSEPQSKYSDQVEILKWRFEVKRPEDTLALRALNDFTGDVLVVESEKDEIIPHQTVVNYINSVNDKSKLGHVVMVGAPHTLNNPKLRKDYLDIITSWLKTESE
jgi:esterase/lipase